jgi:thiamine-phosphate pyrophosphorylase
VEIIQYRDKSSSARELYFASRELVTLSKIHCFRLVVNDRPDVAALAGAGAVHVGQQDLTVDEARRICPPGTWVGISTHTLQQVREAAATSADYIAIGPVFPTLTKAEPDSVVGVDFVRRARAITRKPLVAIGGITLERAQGVYRAGADSLAVASDLLTCSDVAQRASEYLAIARHARGRG